MREAIAGAVVAVVGFALGFGTSTAFKPTNPCAAAKEFAEKVYQQRADGTSFEWNGKAYYCIEKPITEVGEGPMRFPKK